MEKLRDCMEKVICGWSLKRSSFAKWMFDADHRPAEEEYCTEAQALHENLPRLWSPQRPVGCQVSEVSHKEPALEETRNSKVITRNSFTPA
jgi:hypothetical protein